MAGNTKVGGGVSQVLGQQQIGSVDPDAFAPQAHGLQANQQVTPFQVDPLSVEAATAIAAAAQTQTQQGTQVGFGGDAGGDTEVINSGNVGPMVG
jgi:hypothetical protein